VHTLLNTLFNSKVKTDSSLLVAGAAVTCPSDVIGLSGKLLPIIIFVAECAECPNTLECIVSSFRFVFQLVILTETSPALLGVPTGLHGTVLVSTSRNVDLSAFLSTETPRDQNKCQFDRNETLHRFSWEAPTIENRSKQFR
jgi:hypothetical protein